MSEKSKGGPGAETNQEVYTTMQGVRWEWGMYNNLDN